MTATDTGIRDWLKTNGFVKVQIAGHTDTVGSDTYNMKLSVARAQSLPTKLLIAPIHGVGREHPLSVEKLFPVLAVWIGAGAGDAAGGRLS